MSDHEETMQAKFDLSEGTGTPFKELAAFVAAKGRRGEVVSTMEAALEPVHRLVYGRAGITFERRMELEDFKGFPESMRAMVEDRIKRLHKDKLRLVVKAFGVDTRISSSVDVVAAAVIEFLMAPKETAKTAAVAAAAEKKKAPAAKKRAAAAVAKEEVHEETGIAKAPTAKKAKTEAAEVKPQQSASARGASNLQVPSDDTIRVYVYRHVLAMSPEERSSLGVKALRTVIEKALNVKEGSLKNRKEVIAVTASDCVKALVEAEARALGVPPASPPAAETEMVAVAKAAVTEARVPEVVATQ